jgi:glucose dehydrogenase
LANKRPSSVAKIIVTVGILPRLPLCSRNKQQQPNIDSIDMKKLLVAAVALFCATAIVVQAQDAPKKEKKKMTPEQKQVMTDMLAKYDTNKDGKLDKTEKAAMSAEDKAAWAKAFPATHGKKKAADAPAAAAPAAPDAPK